MSIEDQRVLQVLKNMARGSICWSEDEPTCPFCQSSILEQMSLHRDFLEHTPECSVTLARAVLRDMGMPLCIYKMTYAQTILAGGVENERTQWKTYSEHVDFYSEQEALIHAEQEALNYALTGNPFYRRRTTHIEKVKEL